MYRSDLGLGDTSFIAQEWFGNDLALCMWLAENICGDGIGGQPS